MFVFYNFKEYLSIVLLIKKFLKEALTNRKIRIKYL